MVSLKKATEELPLGWKVRVEAKNGRKTKVYIEPLTGNRFYSIPQVTRYLQGLEDKNDGGGQQQQISEKTPVKQQNLSPSVEAKTRFAGRDKNVMKDKDVLDELSSGYTKEINTRKRALERKQNALQLSKSLEHKSHTPLKMDISDVQQRNRLDEHPPGRVKEMKDKDELQSLFAKEINKRKRAHERRDALLEGKNQIQGENDNDLAKPLKMDISVALTDVQRENGLDELPPGWLKESKIRKSCNKKKVDPYYIEITSGYAFRSKKDVQRYLDTGNVNSCAIKPHIWDLSELKQKEDIHRPTPYLGNEAEEPVARRQPFISQEPEHHKETSQINNIVVAEAENARIKDKGKAKHVPALATNLTGSPIVDTRLGSGATSGKRCRESPRLKVDGSKQDIKIGLGEMAVNGTETSGFNDQKLTENCLDVITKTDLRKSTKGNTPSTPGRSSKRLAGHEPEMQPNFNLTERALRGAIKKSHEIGVDRASGKAVMDTTANDATLQQPVMQATTSPNLAWNAAADQTSQQPVNKLETSRSLNLATTAVADKMSSHPVVMEAETTIVHSTSVPAKVSSETGMQSENQNQVLQQTTGSLSERQVEENSMPQDDYWSDPCLEFAFKTLTGAIPLEETLPGCFQQPTGTSFGQGSLVFGLHDFDVPPPFFHNDVQQTAPVHNNVPANELSTNSSTLPPAGNVNLPGCSSQPSLEAQSKDYQTKVKS